MPIPDYDSLDDGLLWFLYRHGGRDHTLRPRHVYDPLADLFGLTEQERVQPVPGNQAEPLWRNRVRWARQHLATKSFLDPQLRGLWRLTPRGVQRASLMPDTFCFTATPPDAREEPRRTETNVRPLVKAVRTPAAATVCPSTAGQPASTGTGALNIDEKDHTLFDIITAQRVSASVVTLFFELVAGVNEAIGSWGDTASFQTHPKGVCGFCATNKAFVYLTVRKDCITALYYSGASKILGLKKGDWLVYDDRAGSELHRIDDDKSLKKAINFASSAYSIAALETAKGASAPAPMVSADENRSGAAEDVLDILTTIPQTHFIAPRFARRPAPSPSPQEYAFDPDDLTI